MPCRKSILAELPEPETIDVGRIRALLSDGGCDLVVVLGPTASGKTRYAVRLAKELDGEIISADSRQIFRGMDIGTGKDLEEYGDVPYHLIDILPAGEKYSVYRFQQDFLRSYEDILRRGRTPILCGGTGLYINAVTGAYAFDGEKHPLSEQRSRTERCTEVSGLPCKPYFIGTLVSREERNARIDRRLDERLKEGMIEEIRTLLETVPAETLISYGLEYKFVTLYLTGQLTYEEMRQQLATAIHQFAKRQMTWFRGMERSGSVIHWTRV